VATSLARWWQPVYPDAGRLACQLPLLRELMHEAPLAGRVLNAGSGEGLFAPFLESFAGVTRIDDVDVVDLSHVAAAFADERHHVSRASLTSLPFADGAFDAAICTEVLEHIEDHGAAARELARVIRTGGTLLVTVPRPPAPFDPNHVREGYTPAELRALLEGAGFTVEAERECCHMFLRGVMRYWRRPWLTFGAHRTPYVPRLAMSTLVWADRHLPAGAAWDLVVRARRV
jgi:SAM-dependent methyltransferase